MLSFLKVLTAKNYDQIIQKSETNESKMNSDENRKHKILKKEIASSKTESNLNSKDKSNLTSEKGKKTNKRKKKIVSPQQSTILLLEDSDEDLSKCNDEEQIQFDTSKLTVAQYYELLELPPGPLRTEYLNKKLSNSCSSPNAMFLKLQHLQNSTQKYIDEFNVKNFQIVGTLKYSEVRIIH